MNDSDEKPGLPSGVTFKKTGKEIKDVLQTRAARLAEAMAKCNASPNLKGLLDREDPADFFELDDLSDEETSALTDASKLILDMTTVHTLTMQTAHYKDEDEFELTPSQMAYYGFEDQLEDGPPNQY
jgi:hypothetical protein